MRQTLGRTIIVALASFILILLAACTAPVDTKGPVTLRQGLTLQWQVNSTRSLYPASYPTPTTYDLLLHSAGQTDVVVTGISTTSWTLENLARVVWTVTVTGKDGAGKAIVQGGTSVDLAVSATQTSNIALQYLSQGTGSGSIHLSLDLSEAPTTPDSVTLTLTDPLGVTTHPVVALNGTTASFTFDPAPVGAYNVYFFAEAGPKSAGKFETVMVFQNVDTAATLKFLGGDFDSTFHPVTGVTLSGSSLQLYTNNVSASLTATVAPANATNPSVAWTSSDPSVATVSQAGLVVPKAVGTTTVTVTTGEGNFTASCDVTVSVKHVVSVSVTPVNLTLVQEGATAQLTAGINPFDASDTSVVWSSSDTAVATVSAFGVVTPVVAGTATITATSTDGAKTGTSAVTVLPNGMSTGNVSILTPAASSIAISGPFEYVIGRTNSAYIASSATNFSNIQWRLDGIILIGFTALTVNLDLASVTPGSHILSFTGKDAGGLTSSASAKFDATCHVVFDANGGTGTMTDQTITTSVPTALHANSFSRVGYTFGGWNTLADGSGLAYSNSAYIVIGSSSVVLVAQWVANKIAVALGYNHSLLVKQNGTLLAVGQNDQGQLGIGGAQSRSNIPVVMMADATHGWVPNSEVAGISVGADHSMVVTKNGYLWATGGNAYNQLTVSSISGFQYPTVARTRVAAVSAGDRYTMFIDQDRVLWAQGHNAWGNLGDGTTVDRSSPVQIMGGVAMVSASEYRTMIIGTDGTLWRTGSGFGGSGSVTSPVQVTTGVRFVSSGPEHVMILKDDHTLWGVGWNDGGQLGDGSVMSKQSPVQIMSDVYSVATGDYHTMILKLDGSLWATGGNSNGQLGDTTTLNRKTPVLVMNGVAEVWAGGLTTMVLKSDGTLWTFGGGGYQWSSATAGTGTPVKVTL